MNESLEERRKELSENLAVVKEQIAEAARSAGRDSSDIHLVAVSKTYPVQDLALLTELGCRRFGENRVQELVPKMEELTVTEGEPVQWDLIGTLQRNKVKYIAGKLALIHSVDRLSLAEEIQRICKRDSLRQDILLQLNISGEESKQGMAEDEVMEVFEAVLGMEELNLRGLMTMAPYTDNPEDVLPIFERCREIFEKLRAHAGQETFDCLSMGMSQDFVQAIRAGATHVRVGSKIFGKRVYT